MNRSAPYTRLSPAARRGLRRWRRTYTNRVTVARTGSAYMVVGTGANEAHRTASTALRLALQPRREERWAARVAASAVPLEDWNRLYVASRAEE